MNKRKGILIALIFGVLLIALATVLMVERIFDLHILTAWWPLAAGLFGVAFLLGLLLAPKGWAVLAIPASVLAMLALILLYQTRFNLWATWSYMWTLLIFAFGVGIWIFNIQIHEFWLRVVGGILTGLGLIKYLAFGFVFEKLLHISGSKTYATLPYTAFMILFGVWVILSPWIFSRRKVKPMATPSTPAAPQES